MSGRLLQLWNKIISLFRARSLDGEFDEELAIHIEMAVEDNIRAGMSAEESRRMALVRLGGTDQAFELHRDARSMIWLDSLVADIRYALRGFRNAPCFTLTVVGTLALGLGALAAAFSIFNALVLRPYPVRDPYSLYALRGWGSTKAKANPIKETFTLREFQDFRLENGVFSEVLGYQNGTAHVDKKGASIQAVTGNYFTILSAPVCMGRGIIEADDQSGQSVIVASYAAWKRRLGADPGIIGKTLHLGESFVSVVGIACPEYNGPNERRVDFWVSLPLAKELREDAYLFQEIPGQPPPDSPKLKILGRLKTGMLPGNAESALLAYGRRNYRNWSECPYPDSARIESRATRIPLTWEAIGTFLPLFLLFGFVLLIACANAANVMLARGLARRRELAVRISIGAGRLRVIRQLFTESVLLAIAAPLGAFGMAYGIVRAGMWLLTDLVPIGILPEILSPVFDRPNLLPDRHVLVFLFAVALITTFVFGIIPAILMTRSSMIQANRGEYETRFRRSRLQSALVVIQSTICVLLLILAGVAVRNENRIASIDLGLDTRGVFWIPTTDEIRRPVLDRLSSLSGIEALGTCAVPPTISSISSAFHQMFMSEAGGVEIACAITAVSPEYFDVYKIPIRGRKVPAKEMDITHSAPPDGTEVVISETVARRLWPSENALGQVIETKPDKNIVSRFRVVGIARDSAFELEDMAGRLKPNRAVVYFLAPPTEKRLNFSCILVRMQGDPETGRRRLESALQETSPGDMHYGIQTGREQFDKYLYRYLVLSGITGFLGAMALLLTTSGAFGMLSYLVNQRKQEFGIRIALGAGKARVTGMVLKQSLWLAAVGSGLGAAAALAAARILASKIPGIDLFDVGGYVAGVLVVMAAALAASWIPARRAVNLDPARTLHFD
jgi:predicted permease